MKFKQIVCIDFHFIYILYDGLDSKCKIIVVNLVIKIEDVL